ncbi:MAG: LemA family protein [Erysipelotrichaceae bacterium]|nr:LemA family protein [Erysipelotrichaceae bacterium]
MQWLFGLLLVVVVVAFWVFSTYNGFISLKNKCEEAFSTMDVYLTKRYDMIPNLVETVKGYASHERETLENVIMARNMAVNAKTVEDKIAAEQGLAGTLGRLFALGEAYPDLKANANFLDLQSQLQLMEAEIANSRKYYNGVVKMFNIKTEQFPSNIIANMFGFARRPLFEVTEAAQRENVKVQF